MKTKFIFVTGGVLSSLGKGICAASIGALLQSRGLSVTIQKLDPYINVDPGTMSPFQHGEVYVTNDGAETDLDLGHYERFLNTHLSKKNSHTAGSIYYRVEISSVYLFLKLYDNCEQILVEIIVFMFTSLLCRI